MEKIAAENAERIRAALVGLRNAALELANVLDDTEYTLSASCPEYLSDPEEFAYELSSFTEDEIETINENADEPHLRSA